MPRPIGSKNKEDKEKKVKKELSEQEIIEQGSKTPSLEELEARGL